MEKMKIFMVGGRRCGKSTVLASMYDNADKTLAGTKLALTANPKLMFGLQDTINQSESYFYDLDTESFVTVSDENANLERKSYPFQLALSGKTTGLEVEFDDVPGEFFTNPAHSEEVKAAIRASHAVIIAIDTPCLLEEMIPEKGFGKYHAEDNKVVEITRFLKENLNVEEIEERLILFVPIKCEKYYYANRMPEVAQAVQRGYRELLTFLASDTLKDHCTAVILPMISLGGLKFHKFTGSGHASPTASQRYIYHNNTVEGPRYVPLYCDQPLLYTIAYLTRLYRQNEKGFLGKIKAILSQLARFANLFDAFSGREGKELQGEFEKLAKKISHDEGKGFVVIQDPLHL